MHYLFGGLNAGKEYTLRIRAVNPLGSGVEAFKWATQVGIINGKEGLLVPQGQATRAEVAAMLHRYGDWAPQ